MGESLDTDKLEREVTSMYRDVRDNTTYEFTSDQAVNACQKYGVRSVSLDARK